MAIPTVAIVGRPNVGKSTLFNRILGQKTAVVEDTPGVTRDRNYAVAEYEGRRFTLIDTGGFEPEAGEGLLSQMRVQTKLAIEEADVVVFVMEVSGGLTASDETVAELLRKSKKPTLYCVNKVDGPKHEEESYDFYRLGVDELFTLSALHGPGFHDMMERLLELLPEGEDEDDDEGVLVHVAIIGRPNVGKSSLVNALCGEDRMVAFDQPGTTVDSIDTRVKYYGKTYNLIDTAGIRSKGKIAWGIEKFSVVRALKAIDRCNVALLLVDASEGLTEQDKKIAGIAHEEGRGVIVLLNKWDLVQKDDSTIGEYIKQIRTGMKYLDYAPILTVSAVTKQRIGKIYELIDHVYEESRKRIPTPELNEILERATAAHPPRMYKGRRIKFYYATQTKVAPPTFVFFVNRPEGVHFSYVRYLENKIREAYTFEGSPLRMVLRKRRRTDDEPSKG